MLDFTIEEETLLMRDNIRKFVSREVEPLAMTIEDDDKIPEELFKQTCELGLFGLSIPQEFGGTGCTILEKCIIFEELGKTHNGYTTLIGAHNGPGTVGLVEFGTEKQKWKYLPPLARGEIIGGFALTEPGAGSNAVNLKTRAEKKGDKYILNGTKHFITNSVEGSLFTVMAVTDKEKGAKGISSFLVEKSFPGFSLGKPERKMGLRGSHSGELVFEDCEVPEENLLGELNRGYVNALTILANGRVGMAGRNLGSSQKLFDLAFEYAQERVQFDRPIGDNQVIQHMLADMAMQIEMLRVFVHKVAYMLDHGEKAIAEAAMAKIHASEVYNSVADKTVQIFGGMGYMKDLPIERFYRDARITRIYEGTSEILRNLIYKQLHKERFGR